MGLMPHLLISKRVKSINDLIDTGGSECDVAKANPDLKGSP